MSSALSSLFSAGAVVGAGLGVAIGAIAITKPGLLELFGAGLLGGAAGLGVRTVLPKVADPRNPTGSDSVQRALDKVPTLPTIQAPTLPLFSPRDELKGLEPVDPAPKTAPAAPPGPAILSPEEAHRLIQSGQYASQVRNARISRWYYWSDTMVSSSISEGNRKTISLQTLRNCVRMALALDKISDQINQKLSIASWIRIQTQSSYHQRGEAVDLNGTAAFKRNTVIPAARRVAEITGIGPSDDVAYVWRNSSPGVHFDKGNGPVQGHRGLHLDVGARNPRPGYQYWFRDNGAHPTTGGNYHQEPMLSQQPPTAAAVIPPLLMMAGLGLQGFVSQNDPLEPGVV